jgi:hypothetical protein
MDINFRVLAGLMPIGKKDVLPKRIRIIFFNHKVHEGDTKGNNSKEPKVLQVCRI